MSVEGLKLVEDLLTEGEEHALLSRIIAGPWDHTLARRTQQYGYRYNYKGVSVNPEPIAAIPDWLQHVVTRLVERGIMETPQQVIINEYKPGQGISAHTDHRYAFGPVVVSLSLGAEWPMVFQRRGERVEVPLLRRSAVVLSGPARYEWTHCIEPLRNRGTRVSVTFRTLSAA